MQAHLDASRFGGSSQENVSALPELLDPEGGGEAEGNRRLYFLLTKGEANQTGKESESLQLQTGQDETLHTVMTLCQ